MMIASTSVKLKRHPKPPTPPTPPEPVIDVPTTNPTESDYPIRVDEYHFPISSVLGYVDSIVGNELLDTDGCKLLSWERAKEIDKVELVGEDTLDFEYLDAESLACLYWLNPLHSDESKTQLSTIIHFSPTQPIEFKPNYVDITTILPTGLNVVDLVLTNVMPEYKELYRLMYIETCGFANIHIAGITIEPELYYADEDDSGRYFFDPDGLVEAERLVVKGNKLSLKDSDISTVQGYLVYDIANSFCTVNSAVGYDDGTEIREVTLYSRQTSFKEDTILVNEAVADYDYGVLLTQVYVTRQDADSSLNLNNLRLFVVDTPNEPKRDAYYFYYPEGDTKWESIVNTVDKSEGSWAAGWTFVTYDDGNVPPTPPTPTKKPLGLEVAKQSDYPVAITEENFPNEWVRNYAISLASEEGLLKWEDAINNTDINLGSPDEPVIFYSETEVTYTLEGVKWFMPADADGNTVKYNLTLWLADNEYYTIDIPLLDCMNSDSVNRLLIGDALFFEGGTRGAKVFNLSQMNVTNLDLIGLEVITSDAEEVWWLDTNSMFVRDADKTKKLITPAKEVGIAGCYVYNADYTTSSGLYLSNAVEKLTVNDTDSSGMFSDGVYLGGDYSAITNPIEASFKGSGTVFVDNSNYNYVESAYSRPSMDEWKLTKYS